jgi:guanine nucleotide-binding protein subunit alpha
MAPGTMCFGRKPADPEFKKNEDIEKVLRVDRKRAEREVKLLLLGMPSTKACLTPCG